MPLDGDQHDLRLLAVLHYVLGGVTAALALPMLPFLWQSIRAYQAFEASAAQGAALDGVDAETAGLIAVLWLAVCVLLVALCVVHAGVLAYIGRCVARRRRRLLCLIFSALHLINVPLGTALSVYAFMVLLRPEVKQAFARGSR